MTPNNNPLQKYFRQAVIHVKLPSNGRYYPPGALNMPANGELPILPMTAVDEITSRTPDALFNGSAIIDIIRSCVPNIIDPWAVPSVDINTLLVSIRMASYGHEMEIPTRCPKCGHSHEMALDLRLVLDHLRSPDFDETVTSGDLEFYFLPMNYKDINEYGKMDFEDQKLIQMLNDSEMPDEEKMHQIGDTFRKLTTITLNAIAKSVSAIKTPDSMVTDQKQIHEFLYNCPKSIFDTVKNHAVKLREGTEIPPVSVVCPQCEFAYSQQFTLDISNFFDNAS